MILGSWLADGTSQRDLVKRYSKISRPCVPPLKINSRDDLKRLLSRYGR
jgi:hypothetical protein